MIHHPPPSTSRSPAVAGLALPDLLNDLGRLSQLLVERLERGDVVNAYLLAAGMDQVVSDYLHADPLHLSRAAARLGRRLPAPWGPLAARGGGAASAALWRAHLALPATVAATRWHRDLVRLLRGLAERWTGAGEGGELEAARSLADRLPALPARLRGTSLRPPSCFRSFDESPEDLEALAAAFAQRWPGRDRRLAVVGIRTSGSYLAPLLGAMLRRRGYRRVDELTLRPGQRWTAGERRLLRDLARDGMVLLVDDPPRTWGSVAHAAGQLVALGFRREQVALVLATFGEQEPPPALAGHPAVLLPEAGWSVRRRLAPEAVARTLGRLLGCTVRSVRPLGCAAGRGHHRARYQAEVETAGERRRLWVEARGVGLGYFGEHALAVADRLRGWVPEVLGLEGGILYEAHPGVAELKEPLSPEDAEAVAGYVLARARALPLKRDPSHHLTYRGIDWRWAADWFGGLFGRGAEVGRLVAFAVVRRLLRPPLPVLTDGRTVLGAFAPTRHGLIKTEYDQGTFGNQDFVSFDPVSDLAQAACSAAHRETAPALRRAYERITGVPIEPERWLLHQLAHLATVRQRLPAAERSTDRQAAPLLHRYYRETLVQDGEPDGGPLCALDLDGVLESTPMGVSATSPAGALALRALLRHGYRVVLATGRSLAEVEERCRAYGLAGGAAEYGAVIYRRGAGARSLVGPEAAGRLQRVRARLEAMAGVHLDGAHRHSIRAFRLEGRTRSGLSEEQVAAALAGNELLRAVRGRYQTDFVPVEVSKERALRELAADLGIEEEPLLALAVGDTVSDLGMLRLARHGVAPANADRGLREAGVPILRRPRQRGLGQAVAMVIGHRPGGCPVCRPPDLPAPTRRLLALLGVQDRSPIGAAVTGLRLWVGA